MSHSLAPIPPRSLRPPAAETEPVPASAGKAGATADRVASRTPFAHRALERGSRFGSSAPVAYHRNHRIATVSIRALLLAAPALLLSACDAPAPQATEEVARPVRLVTARAAGVSEARVYPGRVQATRRVPLAFRVGGPVIELPVSKGQRVAAGKLLARIDPRDYEVQVKNLEATLAAARAQLSQASEEYERVRGLFQHDNASKSDFDRARAAVKVGQAQVESTEASLRAARLALSDTRLRAPFDGVVADRLVDSHQVVSAGQPVLLLQDVRALEVVIDVPEREVSLLTREQPEKIAIHFDAIPGREFTARVKEFATESDPQTQTFPVTLQLTAADKANLLPGMTASVAWIMPAATNAAGTGATTTAANAPAAQSGAASVVSGADPSAPAPPAVPAARSSDAEAAAGVTAPVVIPLSAIGSNAEGQPFAFRLDPQTMRLARVTLRLGALTDQGQEVLSGLAPGDRVLAAGVNFAQDGQLVRPISE